MMSEERFEFEYDTLEEMLIVNHQEGFSYNMCNEGDVYSVAVKLNEQQSIIEDLEKENEQLKKEINMLKVTIGRNESYIERLTHQSNWHC